MALTEKPIPLKGKSQYLNSLNNEWSLSYPNEYKVNNIRKLLEKMLKSALKHPENKFLSLKDLFDLFDDEFSTSGFKNTAIDLIRDLNKWAHHSNEKLTDDECKKLFATTNKILEKLTELKNNATPWINTTTISLLDYSRQLNELQSKAVSSNSDLTLVEAGPGTGKTELVSARMISTSLNPDFLNTAKKIAGISFTNQATKGLKIRLEKNQGGDWVREDGPFVNFTIHSFCLKVYSDFEEMHSRVFPYTVIDQKEANDLLNFLGRNQYQAYLKKEHLLVYDDILKLMLEKLESKDISFENYLKELFYEIVIDEAQDLSKTQYQIFTLLHEQCGIKLFFVGDQRQNIYNFAGGSLNNLKDSFPNKHIAHYSLKESYRCPNKILNFVNTFSFNDCNNEALQNTSNNPMNGGIEIHKHGNKEEEAYYITSQIKTLISEKNSKASEICILSTSSFYFQNIVNALNENSISFDIHGGQQKLKKTLLLFCEILNLTKYKKVHTLKKVADFFKVHLSSYDSSFDQILTLLLEESKTQNNTKFINIINLLEENFAKKDYNLSEIMLKVYLEFELLNKESNKANGELEILKDFILEIEKNDIIDPTALSSLVSPTNQSFKKFFNFDIDLKCHNYNPNNSITISTIHSAKGREWEHVFIPGLTEGIIPHYNSKDINDDLKKFYVACTRVRKNLYLSYPLSYNVKGNYHVGEPSRFIAKLLSA